MALTENQHKALSEQEFQHQMMIRDQISTLCMTIDQLPDAKEREETIAYAISELQKVREDLW